MNKLGANKIMSISKEYLIILVTGLLLSGFTLFVSEDITIPIALIIATVICIGVIELYIYRQIKKKVKTK